MPSLASCFSLQSEYILEGVREHRKIRVPPTPVRLAVFNSISSVPGREHSHILSGNSDNLSDECIFTKNIYTQMEMPTNTWTVVQLLADGTVEAVLNSWLEGDKCYWPPVHKSKLSNAIQQCELPQPSWEHFSVKIFKNSTFGSRSAQYGGHNSYNFARKV
ncbi:uncharacterized protein LOC143220036 isoform X2 [Lasioglossum baleicum]|uniref:uncharacterized protein LOC143220036 isoform X2 n=1 Tax=Lasioglossum baleicum TaxID=434251 RepID=UPI003FCE7B42